MINVTHCDSTMTQENLSLMYETALQDQVAKLSDNNLKLLIDTVLYVKVVSMEQMYIFNLMLHEAEFRQTKQVSQPQLLPKPSS